MARKQWPWAIACLQVMVAMALFSWAPYQFREGIRRIQREYPDHQVQVGLDYFLQHWPPPAEQISWAINFPARILTMPFLKFQRPLIEYGIEGGTFQTTIADVIFFFWVGVLWYWVAVAVFEVRRARLERVSNSTKFAFILLSSGLLFAITTGIFGLQMFLDENRRNQSRAPGLGVLALRLSCVRRRSRREVKEIGALI